MKFRNKSDDAREGVFGSVAVGDVLEVGGDPSGLVLQCGADGAWEPADDEASVAVAEATGEPVKKTSKAKASDDNGSNE